VARNLYGSIPGPSVTRDASPPPTRTWTSGDTSVDGKGAPIQRVTSYAVAADVGDQDREVAFAVLDEIQWHRSPPPPTLQRVCLRTAH